MKKILKQTAVIFAVCIVLLQTGCKNNVENRPVLWYTESSFPFDMTISYDMEISNGSGTESGSTGFNSNDSKTAEYKFTGERTPGSVKLVLTEPENISGLTVNYSNGNCTVSVGEMTVPLSKNAASGLTSLLDALLLPPYEEIKSKVKLGSSETGKTTIELDGFTLTLDDSGLPAEIYEPEKLRHAKITVQPEEVTP